MYCNNCGKYVAEGNNFCPYCGNMLSNQPPIAETDYYDATESVDEYEYEEDSSKIKSLLFIAIPAIVIVACLVIGLLVLPNTTKGNVLTPVDSTGITILDCDADWDSSYHDERYGAYKVDLIMLVQNTSADPISGIEFELRDKSGTQMQNLLDSTSTFTADGYIESGATGVMVAIVWTSSYKEKIKPGNILLSGAYPFEGPEGYRVPTGKLIDAKGTNKDHYTMEIGNPNGVDINSTATFVAIKTEGNKIKDSDATGRIEAPIAANTSSVVIEEVFQDPNFASKYKTYTVYAIDSSNYR